MSNALTPKTVEGNSRKVRLIVTEPEIDRVWAAVKFLSRRKADLAGLADASCWVSIDEIGDFLRKRQIDAARVKFDPKDPNTRYALPPNAVSPKKWDDHTIVSGVILAQERGFLKHLRKDGDNFFTFVPVVEHDLWKLKNTNTPACPEWKGLNQ